MAKNGYILIEEKEEEKETYSIVERIQNLDEDLSIDIVIKNIKDQIEGKTSLIDMVNFVTLFKERVEKNKEDIITSDLKEHFLDRINELIDLVSFGLREIYSVEIGEDTDETVDIIELLEKYEVLYEFFFIRNYENIRDVIYRYIINNKQIIADRYRDVFNNEEEQDLFVLQDKKKFKNFEDNLILNYITEIIYDIRATYNSGLGLFKEITFIDLYETYNNKMDEMLINYGKELTIIDDNEASDKYFAITDDMEYFTNIRNEIVLKLLKNIEMEEKNEY